MSDTQPDSAATARTVKNVAKQAKAVKQSASAMEASAGAVGRAVEQVVHPRSIELS